MSISIAQYIVFQYVDKSCQIILNIFIRKRKKQKTYEDKII